jgi:LysR family transcriptional regulator, carnitine catabolism transcriptional activator
MDLRKLGLFVAVVDAGGFTAAARAVHVAQPSVSLAVKELEREVGAALLVRARDGVTLTPAGEALLAPARRALREVATASAAVDEVLGLRTGHLDVASLPTLAADPVAGIVGRFHAAHPLVTVRLLAPSDPVAVAAAVASGRAEVGVTEAGAHNRGLDALDLGRQELVAVSPPGSASASRPVELARMGDVPLVTTPAGTSLRTIVDDALARAGAESPVAVESEQRDALVPLVLAGSGTAFLPVAVAATAAAQGAVVRRTRPRIERHVVLVHRAEALAPAARALVAAARRLS